MTKKKVIGIAIGVLLIAGIVYIKGNGSKNETNGKTYVTTFISNSNGQGYIEVEGNVEANDTKKVFVDKKLKVKEVFIQEGDYVEKDQVLMTFDETERNNLMRDLRREEIELSKVKRNLEVEKELLKIGGSSKNYIEDLEGEVEKYEINIEEYKEDLEKTAEKILSPVSGTITSLLAQENYSVNTDEPLLELADLSDINIVVEVAEYDIKNVFEGQKLSIKPEVYEKKQEFQGEITKVSKIAQASSTTSENVVEVEVKPLEEIPNLVPGFKVSATIFLEGKTGITIPKNAILEDGGEYYVFVVNGESVISKRVIEIENLKGDRITILSGLKQGEEIVVTPDMDLKEGEKIEVRKMPAKGSRMPMGGSGMGGKK